MIQIIRFAIAGLSRSGHQQIKDFFSLLTRTEAMIASESSAFARQHVGKLMPIKNAAEINDELRPEYDLSKLTGGVRGKYYKRATAGTILVLLEPDVAEAFPDGQTVNEVLRALVKVARIQASTITGGVHPKAMQPTRSAKKPRRVPSARKKRSPRRG